MNKLIKQAMSKRFTWENSAKEYENLYYQAVERRTGAERFKSFEVKEDPVKEAIVQEHVY